MPELKGKDSKPGSRRGSFNPNNKEDGGDGSEWTWESESNPLQPNGEGPAKFEAKPCDKWSGTEKDKMFCKLDIFGEVPPEVTWMKGFKNLSTDPRYRIWTDGENNQAILGIESLKQEDEGAYRCCINGGEENAAEGGVEHEFSIYVTVAGGMDFRAMLAKKKKPAKKVVEKFEWIEEPVDKTIKQGSLDEVTFACKLSHKGKKAKWYLRNQECYKGKKYTMTQDEDLFTLIIKNPEPGDSGRYTCVIRECNDLTCKVVLDVEPPDPEYGFEKALELKKHGQTKKKVKMRCKIDDGNAKVKWFKDGVEILASDPRFLMENNGGDCGLTIKECELEDAGQYTCKIEEFGKEGQDTCTCDLTVGEFPHKFTSQLQGKDCVEDDKVEFKIEVEEDDAEVKWFKDGVEIIPDGKRIVIVKEGKKRKLLINGAKLEDSGNIEVRSNADSSAAPLNVKTNNGFIKGMREFKQCVEREEIIFNVQVKDENAPVEFFMQNGEQILPDPPRVEILNLGEGKHQLVIHKAEMGDMGTVSAKTPSNKGDEMLESKSAFTVIKGEEAPKIGDVAPVTGIAKKQCNMTIPYSVEGEKQSDVEFFVEKDGKLLKIGKDISLTVHGDRVQLDIINPKREKSGVYKVIMKNAQGSAEKLINVNIMDVPTPPLSVYVDTVFADNCIVHWSPPKDDGGTEIKKYIIEQIDNTSGNGNWTECAQTTTGANKQICVEQLIPRHRYRFRVRAANKIGPSEATEMTGPDILAKDPWDEPDPCGQPNIVDWGPDFADLTWAPPEWDGGAPITHYVIEMKEKNMNQWVEGKSLTVEEVQQMGNLIKGKQDGLIEGCEYKFRVRAVNKGGPSKPSPPSVSMIAKTRFLPPHIIGDGIHDLTLKKGRPIRYDIWFGGEPAPNVEWIREGRTLANDDATSLELYCKNTIYTERNTVLSIPKADRDRDTGQYTIKLTCEAGTFEASAYVNVLDVPLKPRNLNPEEIRAEHVKLSWDPPQDDGGTPITGYLVRYMDIDSGEWATACTTSSCNATAKGLKPGHLYQFEVSAINKEGQSEPILTTDPILAENPYRPPGPPGEPKITDFDNKSVTLRWSKPKDTGGRPISHYIIQKKDKFGGWFDALITDDDNCTATIEELEARVPGLSEGKWYQFRIIAVNKAGESDPSPHTRPHLCRHKNLSPSIDKGQAGSKTVRTNRTAIWQIKCKGEPPPTFTWTHPHLGDLSSNEDFSVLHEEYQGGSTTTLVIHHAKDSDKGTYSLTAENRNGKETVDLDLIVLNTLPDCECNLFLHADKGCSCSISYTGPDEQLKRLIETQTHDNFYY